MSDFSLLSLFTAGLVFFAPLSAAYTKPVGAQPEGNPISQPGLASIVPVGKPFTVTWEPTTPGTVTLVLLKGPSTDAEPQYPIAEKIPNDGTYAWTPKDDLEPTADATGYGIQLIVDSNGQYQYTTQFGISNPNYKPADAYSPVADASTSPPSPAGSSAQGYETGGWGHGGQDIHSGYTHPSMPSGTAEASWTTMHKGNSTTSAAHTGPWSPHNVTMVSATGSMTTSQPVATYSPAPTYGSGSAPNASTSARPQATGNAAGSVVASFGGLVLAAGALVFAL